MAKEKCGRGESKMGPLAKEFRAHLVVKALGSGKILPAYDIRHVGLVMGVRIPLALKPPLFRPPLEWGQIHLFSESCTGGE